ncbi:hypothetical protein Syun_008352 [Stephania yunnanensis]|uniref:Uncharacterized protein n=1 Tax=Stephania yunnanensis TaxID=152371 RepID=A0AAP0KCE3_9MAGN
MSLDRRIMSVADATAAIVFVSWLGKMFALRGTSILTLFISSSATTTTMHHIDILDNLLKKGG